MESLEREDFRQWLVAKEPDEVVGFIYRTGSCPGSLWLRSLGFSQSCVHHNAVCLNGLNEHGSGYDHDADRRARWLQTFARRLDDTGLSGRTVTAKQALEVLDSLDVS